MATLRKDSRSPARVGIALALAVAVTVGLVGPMPTRADTERELAAARARLERLMDRIARARDRVDRLQGEATILAGRINVVESRLAVAGARVAALGREIRAAEQEVARTQAEVDRRARAAYVQGPAAGLEILLGSTSLADLAERLEVLDRSARHDADLISRLEDQRLQLQAKRAEAERLQAQLASDRLALRAEQRALSDRLSAAAEALRSLEADRARARALVDRLQARREREIMAARLAAAEARKRARERQERPPAPPQPAPPGDPPPGGGGSGPGDGGGGSGPGDGGGPGPFSVCPVDPPRAYTDDFGAPRPGGRTHQGNDIFAPLGTPVRAPFGGTAVNATNDLGGLAVKVYGSRGYVYNAHLSAFGRLGQVSAGTVIGYVGNTGNAQGTPPHDHFEWHPGNGAAVDPYPYLNQVC